MICTRSSERKEIKEEKLMIEKGFAERVAAIDLLVATEDEVFNLRSIEDILR